VVSHPSDFGIQDLFVAGAGFDIAGAYFLARGLLTSPEQASQMQIQGGNSFARFTVRAAEDYADGRVGIVGLLIGFIVQASAYVLSAPGSARLASSIATVVGLVASTTGAILLVIAIGRFARPRLRNRWLLETARIDSLGFRHADPSGQELFTYGRVLNIRAYQEEFVDNASYAWRVFKTTVRDANDDVRVRPAIFQPFAALDNPHGYYSENPKRRWWTRSAESEVLMVAKGAADRPLHYLIAVVAWPKKLLSAYREATTLPELPEVKLDPPSSSGYDPRTLPLLIAQAKGSFFNTKVTVAVLLVSLVSLAVALIVLLR
jgi:hypothetical protein